MGKISIIVFRECLEISILLSLILANVRGITYARFYVGLGTVLGAVLSCILAVLMSKIHTVLYWVQNDVFEASIMLITSASIIWNIIWLQGTHINIKNKISQISQKIYFSSHARLNYFVLAFIVTITVLREGSEIVLFLYGASFNTVISSGYFLLASFVGAFAGFLLGVLLYHGLLLISLKNVFKTSSFLLILVSAGLASEAASKLTSSGTINILNNEVWNTSWFINNSTLLGKLFAIMIGYDPTPNALQIIFYTTNIAISLIIIRMRKNFLAKRK